MHYEHTTMQYTESFSTDKIEIFKGKTLIFLTILLKTLIEGTISLLEQQKLEKTRYTPAYPSFAVYNFGIKGGAITRTHFHNEQ